MTMYQVGPGMRVELSYRVYDAEGESLTEQGEEVCYLHGFGELLPSIESALDAHHPGDVVAVELTEEQGYGQRDPENILEVERAEFPENVAEGDRFEVENDSGGILVFRVLEVGPEAVLVDVNHPLAGQRVRFELCVRAVFPATDEEMRAAEARLAESPEPVQTLLSPQQLLRGKARR